MLRAISIAIVFAVAILTQMSFAVDSGSKGLLPYRHLTGGGVVKTGKASFKKPKIIQDCWECYQEFPNLPVGETLDWSGWDMHARGDVTITFGTYTHSGSPDFVVTSDGCSGVSIVEGSPCLLSFSFTATQVGTVNTTISWPATICSPSLGSCWNDVVNWYLTGISSERKPDKPCEKCGSLINVDSQTMVETIPIVGTQFSLNYSSATSPAYVSIYNTLGTKAAFNPGGWTFSPVHFYDSNQRILYRGDGSSTYARYRSIAGLGQVVVSQDGSEVYVFNSLGQHLSTLYSLTGSTKYTFTYNGNNKLQQISDAFGNATTIGFDGSGYINQVTAPSGQVTTITTNGAHLISSVENPNGEKFELTYKSGTNLLQTFKYPAGQISTFTYDSNGRLTKDEASGGNYWDLSQDLMAPYTPVSVVSKLGRETEVNTQRTGFYNYSRWEILPTGANHNYFQDFQNNQWAEWFDDRTTTSEAVEDERFTDLYLRPSSLKIAMDTVESTTTYGRTVTYPTGVVHGLFNFNSIVDTSTKNGQTTTSTYSASTKSRVTTTPEGATSTLTIDAYERPVGFQAGTDTGWSFTYGTDGKLSSKNQGGHKTQTFTYNSDGYVSKITNARSEDVLFSYDLSGRVSQVTLPDTRVVTYAYDTNGNVIGVTPPGKPQHVFGINGFDILGSYQPPSIGLGITKNTTYSYNDDKQLTQIDRPDGQSIIFNYHATKERLTSVVTPGGNYAYHYDATSQKLNKIDSPYGIYDGFEYYGDTIASDAQKRTSDDLLFGKTTFTFDGSHRINSRTIRGNASSPTSTINYSYNHDDKLTAVGDMALTYSYPSGRLSTTSIDRVSDSYTYDSYGDLVGYSAVYTPATGSPTTLYTYTLTRDSGGRISQKVETIGGVTSTYVYTYDSAGRLTLVTRNGTTTDSFTYDSNSNRTSGMIGGTSFSATYDDQDRLVTLGPRTYTYNNNGDMTRIQWSATPSDKSDFVYDVIGNLQQVTLPGGTVLDYVSDGLDRRAVKRAAGAFVFRFLYEDQYRISAIVNGMNAYVKEFVYATKVNVPDYMITNGFNYKIITDHLGSPRLVVRTDNGAVAQRMDYSTLGTVSNDTNAGFQPFGFAGGIYDANTQLVKLGARDYDPRATGRWTTKDPIRFEGEDVNLYGYVMSDPINLVDPSGLLGAPAFAMPDKSGPGPDDGRVEPVHPEDLLLLKPSLKLAGECAALANANRYLRIGMGRKGGERVFRITGDLLGGKKIDLFNFGRIK